MPASEAVPAFNSLDDLKEGLRKKNEYSPKANLYPRDGTILLSELEDTAAGLNGAEAGDTLNPNEVCLFNSGMSALITAIEVAIYESGTKNPVIAYASELYSQTDNYISDWVRNRGAQLVCFKSDDIETALEKFDKHNVDVIIAETVANGPSMAVLDHARLLEYTRSTAHAPVVVLDNTLPLSTGNRLMQELHEDDKVIVAESGTKSYTQNAETSGFVLCKNEAIMKRVRIHRRGFGTMPGLGSLERIRLLLPESKRAFDVRNERIYAQTAFIALELAGMTHIHDELRFSVSHPRLESHINHALAGSALRSWGSPVLFLKTLDGEELVEHLWANDEIKKYADLGQSFGFDRTRVLPDERKPAVRIAVGAETDVVALAAAFKSALRG